MSFTLSADLSGLDRMIDALGTDVEDAVRPAAQAGAQVLYDAVRRNVSGIGTVTGKLGRSIYQVYSKSSSGPARATYHVSWNHIKAPHGHLVEFGHIQRYRVYRGNDGKTRLMVRPGMESARKPRRNASQAEKDAYYIPLPDGPRQVPAKPFIRPAFDKVGQAVAAVETELFKRIGSAYDR